MTIGVDIYGKIKGKFFLQLLTRIFKSWCFVMTKCDCCSTPFKWGEILKKNFFYGPITCRNCNCVHKIDVPSRFLTTLFSVVPFLLFGMILSPFHNIFFTIVVALLIFVSGMLVTPFVVNYKLVSK
ncbi:TIGR04104 family putative zinc finger protein [Thalassobacillus sp. B23F22_16]|uniref:TIGR04104 family putative zinc finger protein n=1 Tax=Thalassobacillus sp. B23F22_16 TaxID=3459513 RepID=UPI00373F87F1